MNEICQYSYQYNCRSRVRTTGLKEEIMDSVACTMNNICFLYETRVNKLAEAILESGEMIIYSMNYLQDTKTDNRKSQYANVVISYSIFFKKNTLISTSKDALFELALSFLLENIISRIRVECITTFLFLSSLLI